MNKIIPAFSIFLAFVSCDTKYTMKNQPKDIEDAKGYTSKFYKWYSENQIDSISAMCAQNINAEDVKNIIKKVKLAEGELKQVDITKTETNYTSFNGKESVEYNVELNVSYEKGKTTESVGFKKENGILILTGYHFNIKD